MPEKRRCERNPKGERTGEGTLPENRAIGQVWESRSNGTCLFLMPVGDDLEAIRHKIIFGTV